MLFSKNIWLKFFTGAGSSTIAVLTDYEPVKKISANLFLKKIMLISRYT